MTASPESPAAAAAQPASAAPATLARSQIDILVRTTDVLRDIARGGLAGILAGILVGGVGGRIVMSAAAVLNPQATGLRTENGELVGAFTLNGTLALITFGGLLGGAVAGVVWVVVSPWIPGTGVRRAALVTLIAVALGGFILIEADNPDFIILGRFEAPIVGMLVALVALVGSGTAWLDGWFERHLPRPGADPRLQALGYGAIAVVGLPFALLTLRTYLDPTVADDPPVGVGWALVATGAATITWWAARIATGRSERPPALLAAGRIALVAAVILGGQFLLTDVADILDLG